jgi:TfoX N-terminal domain
MAWIKVPPENHPIFEAALPDDPRVETMKMFGGVAAKVNGHIFAGLFGLSVMLALPEPERSEALAIDGAGPFDPMGDGRARSDKVMLPERFMRDAAQLRHWIARAFEANARLLPKATKKAVGSTKNGKATAAKGGTARKSARTTAPAKHGRPKRKAR